MMESVYQPHPIALKIPPMSPDEYTELCADIAKNGLLSPITLFEGKILDGRHRDQGCHDVGVEPAYELYTGDDPLGFVLSKNMHRRHLTAKQRRELAKEYLREHSEQSDGAVAKATGAHHDTVAAVRAEIAEEMKPPEVAANSQIGYKHDSEEERAAEPAQPALRVERGLKKDGTPRQARGRKPGTATAPKEPAGLVPAEPLPTELGPPEPEPAVGSDEDNEDGKWANYTETLLATRTDNVMHALLTLIGRHEHEIQTRIKEVSRRGMVQSFARSLGLKLADA